MRHLSYDIESYLFIFIVGAFSHQYYGKKVNKILNTMISQIIIRQTFKNNLKQFHKMDSLIAFKGKDYVIMAADTFNAYSILRMKSCEDKIWNLDGEKLMGVVGEHSDVLAFGDYVQKNLAFMEYKNGHKLSIDDTASFIRHELAEAIRKGPYSVNILLAGFEGDKPRLYWLDYLGSVIEVRKAAHGYAEYLVSSAMDTLEHKDVPLEQAKKIIDQCIHSMRERFLMSQTTFTIKVITKNGIQVIREAERPQGISKIQTEGVSQGVTRGY